MHSETYKREAFHSSISYSKGLLNGENCIVYVSTICSSSIAIASSKPVTENVPVLLKGSKLNSTVSQSFFILTRLYSILYSFPALSPMSTHSSINFCKSISKQLLNVNPSNGFTSNPTFSEIAFQCLSFMPSVLRARANGTDGLNSSTSPLIYSAILRIPGSSLSLKSLIT